MGWLHEKKFVVCSVFHSLRGKCYSCGQGWSVHLNHAAGRKLWSSVHQLVTVVPVLLLGSTKVFVSF